MFSVTKVRRIPAILVAAVLGLVSPILVCVADARNRLDGREMRESRGCGQNLYLGTFNCSAFAGYSCSMANTPCNSCGPSDSEDYQDTSKMTGGGYDPGTPGGGSCGNIFNGTCTSFMGLLYCNTNAPGGGDTGNKCKNPPSAPVKQ